ncbi:hypothetical protein [Campylobacter cuniculorum]|uniref:hypothetical protein n=1 Tax=Campylobacter cuniculorum TaxID=374106 RepID=UPI0023F52829|nr:hypothetical protein [Campylobacter cuniculorum]
MYEKLNFYLKGGREYIRGTDIFNKILSLYSEDTLLNFKLIFHNISQNSIILVDIIPEDKNSINFICEFDKVDKDCIKTKITLYGIEDKTLKPKRIPYDFESEIIKFAEFDSRDRSIMLLKPSQFSFIEELIALYKELLTKLFNQKGWLFTRLELKEIPPNDYPIKLKLKTNFNLSLVKSEILVRDKSFGFIYFSLKAH